jgi:hypothetical protein
MTAAGRSQGRLVGSLDARLGHREAAVGGLQRGIATAQWIFFYLTQVLGLAEYAIYI